MTVSRVVNGRGGVTAERADRVQRAIEKLDYRHNVTARHLRLTGQSTATIGVLLEDVANPFAAEFLRAVENVMSDQGRLVLCASSDGDAAREKALLGAFCTRRVDGLIIVPCGPDHRYLLPETRRGTQVVFADRPLPPSPRTRWSATTSAAPGSRRPTCSSADTPGSASYPTCGGFTRPPSAGAAT